MGEVDVKCRAQIKKWGWPSKLAGGGGVAVGRCGEGEGQWGFFD